MLFLPQAGLSALQFKVNLTNLKYYDETVLKGDRLPLWLPPDATQLHPGSKVRDCGWAGHSLSLEETVLAHSFLAKHLL